MSEVLYVPVNQDVIIQQGFSWGHTVFTDMMRLSYPRHSAYAASHGFDYWHTIGSLYPQMLGGGWCKIALIAQALERYEFVAWIDADAAITEDCDLREALPPDKCIGAVLHDAPWFHDEKWKIPAHYNVGVTYWRSTEVSRAFVGEWFASHPGDPRWVEQGAFNALIEKPEYAPYFHACEDTWNATINVHHVKAPKVTGWHGVQPLAKRYAMMKAVMKDDHLKFKV